MIRIFKDNDIKLVTQGTYKNLYASLGYKPVIEEEKKETVINEPVVKEPQEPVIYKKSSKNKRNKGE